MVTIYSSHNKLIVLLRTAVENGKDRLIKKQLHMMIFFMLLGFLVVLALINQNDVIRYCKRLESRFEINRFRALFGDANANL
jgi:hypothetical protein